MRHLTPELKGFALGMKSLRLDADLATKQENAAQAAFDSAILAPLKDDTNEQHSAKDAILSGKAKVLLKGQGILNDANEIYAQAENHKSTYEFALHNCKYFSLELRDSLEERLKSRGGATENNLSTTDQIGLWINHLYGSFMKH